MSNTITLSELAHAIEDRETSKRDVIVNPAKLEVTVPTEEHGPTLQLIPTESTVSPVAPMEITDLAHDQIAGWTPIGKRYYEIMKAEQPELWADNVNAWLADGEKPRMLRMEAQPESAPKLRAFLSDQFGRYEDVHMLQPLLERINDRNWDVLHCALTERRMHIRVGFPNLTGEVKVGDVVQAGAAFTNSEVGCSMFKSEFFVERLTCLNGMKFSEKFAGFSRRHITAKQNAGWLSPSTLAIENELLQAQVADTLDMMNDKSEFDRMLELMKDTTAHEIEQPMEAVRVLARRVGLSNNERLAVEGNLVRGGDSTLWGLVNSLTATARDIPSFDRRAELEDAAGKLMTARGSWTNYTDAVAA